jgi:hypothetical protein
MPRSRFANPSIDERRARGRQARTPDAPVEPRQVGAGGGPAGPVAPLDEWNARREPGSRPGQLSICAYLGKGDAFDVRDGWGRMKGP